MPRSSARSACSPTSPGPKVRAGPFPDGGVDLLAGSLVTFVPGPGDEHRAPRDRRLPDAARRRRPRRPHRARRRHDHPRRGVEDVDRGVRRGPLPDRGAGPPRRAPAVPSAVARRFRPREDLVLADTIAAAGVDFIALSFVAPRRRRRRAACGRRRPRPDRGQDRDRRGDRRARRDRRRRRRGDGGPRRPRHRVPARGRAAPAEADHPPLRRGRHAGDHGDADARDR